MLTLARALASVRRARPLAGAAAQRALPAAAAAARGFAAAPAPPRAPHTFFVQRAPGGGYAEVEVAAGSSVAALVKATIAELRLDAPPDAVALSLSAGGAGAPPLDETLSLDTAIAAGALAPRAKLLVSARAGIAAAQLAAAADSAADARIFALAAALRDARVVPIEGATSGAALVTLPAGVGWPQLGASPLFVRSFYEGCYEGVLRSLDEGGTAEYRKFTVIGNAGIGKSAFGAYVLWRSVCARRTVVYVSDKVDDAFIIHSDGRVESFDKEDFNRRTRAVRSLTSTVLICDGVTPPIVDAFTLLITSPKRERWKEFDKIEGSRRLFFPVFSRPEMSDMMHACFSRLLVAGAASGGEAGVWARYGKWGGIPRYVFGKLDVGSQRLLESAVTSIKVDELFDHLGARGVESDDAASHRLVHLKPVGEAPDGFFVDSRDGDAYDLDRSELGSPFIKKLVARQVKARHINRLRDLLASGHVNGEILRRPL
jgi:hypothetical protein